jgi:hypothetical protein
MRVFPKPLVYLGIIPFLLFPLASQEQPKIHEKVKVVNLEMLVRVFDAQDRPVGGLKKDDFRIQEGKAVIPINGFVEIRRKIAVPATASRRLFVLIYNVGDTRKELEKSVDVFFEKICRPGDRLMVMTNHFVFNDHVVSDFALEKEKIKNMLRLEIGSLRIRLMQTESKLGMLVGSLKKEIEGEFQSAKNPMGLSESELKDQNRSVWNWYRTFQRFYSQYLQIFRIYRDEYLTLDVSQYARMSDYLEKQDEEKYALVFYQQGVFPFFKTQSYLQRLKEKLMTWLMLGDSNQEMQIDKLLMDAQRELEAPSAVSENEIAKLFLNSGATFHTLLMMPTFFRDLEDLEYQNVAVGSENIVEKLTEMTNGVLASFSKYESFFRQVEQKENVYYRITYAPADGTENTPVKVVLRDKKIRAVYDNQRHPEFIREILDRENAVPQVTIQEMALSGKNLHLTIAGFRIPGQKGDATPGKGNSGPGAVDVRCRVWNGEYALVHDETRTFAPETGPLGANLNMPALAPGNYQMILDVTDRHTGKGDLTVRDLVVGALSVSHFAEQKEIGGGIEDESACLNKTGKEVEDCFQRLADASLARDDLDLAAKYYERSGEGSRIEGFERIGQLLLAKREMERALLFLEKAKPSRVRARAYAGQADRFLKKGKETLAKYYFQKAINDFENLSRLAGGALDENDAKEYSRCLDQMARLKK